MKAPVLKTIIIAASLACAATAAAQVFKYIDENGNVAYSDRPVVGAEEVKIKETRKRQSIPQDGLSDNTPRPAAAQGRAIPGDGKQDVTYSSLEILTPKDDKIIDVRTGTVQIVFLPSPALGEGDQIVLNVNGKDMSKGRSTSFSLNALAAGGYSITGRIVNGDGETRIGSTSVSIKVGDLSVVDGLAH